MGMAVINIEDPFLSSFDKNTLKKHINESNNVFGTDSPDLVEIRYNLMAKTLGNDVDALDKLKSKYNEFRLNNEKYSFFKSLINLFIKIFVFLFAFGLATTLYGFIFDNDIDVNTKSHEYAK